MPWLIPSVIATATGTAILTVCYFYLYSLDCKNFLKIWAISWAVYFTRYVFLLVMLFWQKTSWLLIANQLASLLSGVLLLYGTYLFINKKFPRIFSYLSVLGGLWIFVSILNNYSFLAMSLPTFSFLAGIYVWTGIVFLQSSQTEVKENTIVGIGFILWGIHKANYPFLQPVVWFAPWGYLLAAAIEFIVALGLLLVYFRKARDEITASEEKFRSLAESSRDYIMRYDRQGRHTYMNPAALAISGLIEADIIGKTHLECGFPEELCAMWEDKIMQVFATDEPYKMEYSLKSIAGPVYLDLQLTPEHDAKDRVFSVLGVSRDITERKQAEEDLKKIEWLLEKEKVDSQKTAKNYIPDYGDVTKHNTDRTILDNVGAETLKYLCSDIMDLLDTSIAIYEKNGDYAFGQFDSIWCQTMDLASFRLCKTQDSKKALNCGKWLCHENCWNDSAKEAIKSQKTTDIECIGGIHLYGVPIYAGKNLIGVINMGYGSPPTDERILKELAKKYHVEYEVLFEKATKYKTRPPFIIENAKQRLYTVAQLIGKIVDSAQKEKQIVKAREKSEESEASLREAQRISNIGNWSLNLQTGSVEMSDEILNLIGLKDKNEASIVSNHEKFYTPESWQRFNEAIETAINKGKSYEIELEFSDKNAKYRSALARGEVTYGENNKVIGLKGTLQDITESKKAEKEIRRLNAELEQRVSERTVQLEATNKELEAFAYSVSHDLRAPLRHIDGYVNLLVSSYRADLPDKERHYLDTIASSARRMGVLIDDLLQFSRTGQSDMRLESTDVNKVLQEALTTLREDIEGRSIEWVINDLPSVKGDHTMLRQVWFNLLGNAIKYTRPREVARITVSASREKGEIIFVVADNGVGFDMKYVRKLFGVFQRLHSAEEFEGTGIGLATVQRIITRHGGRIWAEAELNVGATFYFSLPG